MFGVADHQYRLGPPVDLAFVRAMEKKYHFRFPDDYVQFITEVGDGGAGPGYGLYPFGYYCTEAKSKEEAKAREMYLRGMDRVCIDDQQHQTFPTVGPCTAPLPVFFALPLCETLRVPPSIFHSDLSPNYIMENSAYQLQSSGIANAEGYNTKDKKDINWQKCM